jgi:Transcriptional accessory protein
MSNINISIKNVANKLQIKPEQVDATLQLLNNGATIPFISRYRKNITGGLDEEVIAKINDYYVYDIELLKRKEFITNILNEKGLLTEELKNKINDAFTKQEVENIYEPFKIGKKTKASEAIALGLEPFAQEIMTNTNINFDIYKEAKKYISDKLKSVDEVILQTKYIIAQIISQDIDIREYVKNNIYNFGIIETKIKKNAIDEKQTFLKYYDYKEKIKYIPNHRILAINRGEEKKILSYDLIFNEKPILYFLRNKYFINKRTATIINESLDDSLKRLVYPSIIREIKNDLFAKASSEAIKLFATNLEQMLLAPAVKNKRILSIDPAYVNGCKIAILNEHGDFLEKSIIYPNPPKNQIKESEKIVTNLIDKYKINLILIGNGTASRETENFIKNILFEKKSQIQNKIEYLVVSEIGASVYSASEIAKEEFPHLNVEERSAINIGRKFQDPLNELIKIDPKSIGIGQYQHDVNQKELMKELYFKIDKVVNIVGVDLNTATKSILSHISGLNEKLATNIIEYRKRNGKFENREELKNVSGINEKVYEQSIGFLRLFNSNIFYDKTNIHPESYENANKLVEYLNINLFHIDKDILENIKVEKLEKEININQYELKIIIDSLLNPGKDIRDDKKGFILNEKIKTIDDIELGSIIQGQVLNITDFGVFVYIGIKQSVLIHISKMKKNSNDFVTHPSSLVSVGDNLSIKIIDIERDRDRIQGEII